MPGQDSAQSPGTETANLNCIHCGLCLSVCPTYLLLGSEADSPRGRIYLIKALEEGRVTPTSAVFEKHVYRCLECRACETACPSGVRYSVMMNGARQVIRQHHKPGWGEALVHRLIFRTAFPSRRLLHAFFRLLRFYQRSGLRKIVQASRVLRLLPKKLQLMESLLPEIPKYPAYHLPETAARTGRSRVSLFEGCIMPDLFGPVQEATLRVLEHNDVSVCSPSRQTCCGALHLHDGEVELARQLARRNIEAFARDGAEFIVVNAAGCGAMLKEYGELLRDDPVYAVRAAEFSRRVKDISEYLAELGIYSDMGRLEMKATYDDPCHLAHGQGIRTAPRRILRSIPGLEFVELRDSERCCGSAGIYNITQPELAAGILEEKISNLKLTGAEVVASGNPGCLLQIQNGLRRSGVKMKVAHPVELLDMAYREKREGKS
jgi:glycolate oxidase iron-sulfur subunit